MGITSAFLVLLTLTELASHGHGFSIPLRSAMTRCLLSGCCRTLPELSLSFASSSDNGSGDEGSSSRIQGNRRPPTETEVVVMDEMIDKLSIAKPYELPNAVRRAFRVLSSPQFFLRIAERSDRADSEEEKERLSALASNLVSTLEAVVETTEERLEERAKEVEMVVKAAAEPDSGEFLVPLLPERIEAMRTVLEDLDESSLDEGFLSTLDSWMNKSHKDGMDLMVGILQKAMQLYAGTQIRRALSRAPAEEREEGSAAAAELLDRLLRTDADSWEAVIRQCLRETPDQSPGQLLSEAQRAVETTVLSLEAGSMAQRVQAEYLQELIKRIEGIPKGA